MLTQNNIRMAETLSKIRVAEFCLGDILIRGPADSFHGMCRTKIDEAGKLLRQVREAISEVMPIDE